MVDSLLRSFSKTLCLLLMVVGVSACQDLDPEYKMMGDQPFFIKKDESAQAQQVQSQQRLFRRQNADADGQQSVGAATQVLVNAGPSVANYDGVLTTTSGQTLYIPKGDMLNRSGCQGACLQYFFPHLPSLWARPSRQYGFFMRDNGTTQWAYNGKPLFVYRGDLTVGHRNGTDQFGMTPVAYPTLGAEFTPQANVLYQRVDVPVQIVRP